MGDIYSFGMVMYEIIFRSLPFPNGTNINGKINFFFRFYSQYMSDVNKLIIYLTHRILQHIL